MSLCPISFAFKRMRITRAIGHGQTIQPYIVAFMTEQLDPKPTDHVLEIGAGSGYQAAVLSGLVAKVYTMEIVEPLGRRAEATLQRLNFKNVKVKVGDGYQGWPELLRSTPSSSRALRTMCRAL